ncbi:MAG: hypothetical protein Q9182_005925 [Xanthomendoza sp. 2 TL-2023]
MANKSLLFSIDGVLLRSSEPLPRANQTLNFLQRLRIPFILLTNGGGKHESDRVAELSRLLRVPISLPMFIQSHTPFADLIHQMDKDDRTNTPLKNKTILVCGGDGDSCRRVAESYGFTSVVTPADLIAAHPHLLPFTSPYSSLYSSHARPLPHPLYTPTSTSTSHLTISSVFVFADPRDWALDTQIILDCLLSQHGVLGTLQRTVTPSVPLYFSNPDLQWASHYHLPRLGQGGFKAAFQGVWEELSGGAPLRETTIGKPSQGTFEFAEKRLVAHRRELLRTTAAGNQDPKNNAADTGGIRKVYMVGDNPLSDIAGGNNYRSPYHSHWDTILVRSGVYDRDSGMPAHEPTATVDGVWEAVEWALERERWPRDGGGGGGGGGGDDEEDGSWGGNL